MVAGTLCASVVARINITKAGGSSIVFNSALKASVVSICTSSMIYTLYFPSTGANFTVSRKFFISSIPLLDAASISNTSIEALLSIFLHDSQTPHGSPSFGLRQFKAFAKIFAVLVFPVPLGPVKR